MLFILQTVFGCRAFFSLFAMMLGTGGPVYSQYRFDAWTVAEGLPQNVVRGIRQSADGYLWIATFDGLSRFDGVRFTTYNKANTKGIASNRFSWMVQTTDGDLWLVAESAGVTRYHAGSFTTYGSERGIPGGVVSGINADHDGHLWLLADNRILFWQPATGRFTDVTPESHPLRYTPSIWTNGGFWAESGTHLYLFHEGRLKTYTIPEVLRNAPISEAGIDPDTSVLLETVDGRQGRVYTEGTPGVRAQTGPQVTTWKDLSRHIWTMPLGFELRRYLTDIADVPGGRLAFNCFFEDRQGNLWLGTDGYGLYRFKRQTIKSYSQQDGLASSSIYPMLETRDGDIWAGAWGAGLSRFHDGRFSTVSARRGAAGMKSTALFEDRRGRIWIGSEGGLVTIEQGRLQAATGPILPADSTVHAIEQGSDGTLWFGTDNGLVSYQDNHTRVYKRADGLGVNDIRTLVWSRSGDLWVGGYGGISRFANGGFSNWKESDGLPSNAVRALLEDAAGTLWIGTYDGGLGRLRQGKLTRYRVADGLFDYGVFALLEDNHGNLWMSSSRGIYSVAKRQLNDFAEGKRTAITSVAYGKGDGMLNIECNGGVWPAGIRTRDGKLWFPTQGGIAIVNPDATYIDSEAPPVIIESGQLENTAIPVSEPLRIEAGQQGLEIQYTSPSLIKPSQIHFRYRMNGLEDGWTDAGTRRTAYYPHLPPGHYTFQVIAGNSDGIWNLTGQSLAITMLPPFYLTWWFEAVMLAVFTLMAAMAWYFRGKQFQERQRQQKAFSNQMITSQETERKRIAAELHDGLGQRLVVIKQLTQLSAPRRGAADEATLRILEEIRAETSAAIQETREISYNLRPFQLEHLGLTRSIAALIRRCSDLTSMQIASELDNIDDFFPDELRINLYRIIQECLNNIVKHSHATDASVQIARSENRIVVSIEDNGVGMSRDTGPSPDHTGFGLKGMSERAGLLSGTLTLQSTAEGTSVTFMADRSSRADA